jgi:imidazoleglycerol-phosphate dehydratase/histidinol-phosphatase
VSNSTGRKRRILFIDRDGTLIIEPADQQIDSLEKLELMPGVVPALLKLRDAGYELVIVSNQDGLGTESYPQLDFEVPQQKMLNLFASQGVTFSAIHIDPHFEHQNSPDRKPGIGMLLRYLQSGDLDMLDSWVIGDRQTDLELAENLGIGGLLIGGAGENRDPMGKTENWASITHRLINRPRQATVERKTNETDIRVYIDLDADGNSRVETGIGFFDHMLDQLASHGDFLLELSCKGDLEIDEHHTVEDCALGLGQALNSALGERRGIGRYGFLLPMDESLAQVAVDLSGRPAIVFEADFPRDNVGGLSAEMVQHFFASLSQSLGAALHLKVEGANTHHMVEALFKGLGRALKPALARQGTALPSTKGML